MSKFGFGTPGINAPASGTFSFGATPPETTVGMPGIGAPPAFGSTIASPTNTVYSIGSPMPVPGVPQPSLGMQSYGIGSPMPATSLALGFASSTPAPAFGAAPISFGTPQQNTQPPAFGAQPLGTASLTFGSPLPATTTLPTFVPSVGVGAPPSFGATMAANTTSVLGGFGQTPATPISSAAGVGAPLLGTAPALGIGNMPSTALTFGATPVSRPKPFFSLTTKTTAAPLLNFNTPTTATPLLNMNPTSNILTSVPGSAAPLSFGITPTTTATPALNFSTGILPATSIPMSTISAPTFGIGGIQTSNTLSLGAPTTNVGFGISTTAASTAQPSLSMFGARPPSAVAPSLAETITVPQAAGGLGGVDLNAIQPKTAEGKNEVTKVKETPVPQEIMVTVEALKQHIKQQKAISSDIARTSNRKMLSVTKETERLHWSLVEISNHIEKNQATIKQLKKDTAEAVQNVEMAQRTYETPPGLQFENTSPTQFFANLVQKYETDLIAFKNQVEMIDKHMQSMANPQSITPDDLKRGLHQMHESFVALAGKLHDTHQKVEVQKEEYLHMRRSLLGDKTNVFEDAQTADSKFNGSKISAGPTPFSNITGMEKMVLNPAAATTSSTANFGFGQPGPSTVSFGSSFGNLDGTFNLQTPPLGAKRNKQ